MYSFPIVCSIENAAVSYVYKSDWSTRLRRVSYKGPRTKDLLLVFRYRFANDFIDGRHAVEDQFQAGFTQGGHAL